LYNVGLKPMPKKSKRRPRAHAPEHPASSSKITTSNRPKAPAPDPLPAHFAKTKRLENRKQNNPDANPVRAPVQLLTINF
jgi:hypothetical protein